MKQKVRAEGRPVGSKGPQLPPGSARTLAAPGAWLLSCHHSVVRRRRLEVDPGPSKFQILLVRYVRYL